MAEAHRNSTALTTRYFRMVSPSGGGRTAGGTLILLLLLSLWIDSSASFAFLHNKHDEFSRISSYRRYGYGQSSSPSPSQLSMCICIDCARVTNCAAYHFVETKHEQPHMTEDPTFSPREGSPTIHVNVRQQNNRDGDDDDDDVVARMWKEHKAEEIQAEQQEAAVSEQNNENKNNDNDEPSGNNNLHGKTVYDLSARTTVEYDVVACADFVEDKGCWVRNMPEEIRAANPDFVPT